MPRTFRTNDPANLPFHKKPGYAVGFLALFTVFMILLSTALLLWDMRKRGIDHDEQETISFTRMFLDQSERSIERADLILHSVQERLQDNYGSNLTLDSVPVQLMLSARTSGIRLLREVFLVDMQGQVVNSSRFRQSGERFVGHEEFFTQAVRDGADRLIISHPARAGSDRGWVIYLARLMVNAERKPIGLVVAAVNLASLEEIYRVFQPGYARAISLYLNDGTLLAGYPHREDLIGDRPPELGKDPLPAPGDGIRLYPRVNGWQESLAVGTLSRYPLSVSATTNRLEALAEWRESSVPITLGAALVILFVLTAAGLLVREINREQRLMSALEDAMERYHQTVDSVMDAIVAVDGQQRVILFNPAAERLFGYTTKEIMGKPLSQLIPTRFASAHDVHMAHFLQRGPSSIVPQREIVGLHADGHELPLESTFSHTLVNGQPQFTAVLRDVSERRRAEQALQALNQQLRGLSTSLHKVREQERSEIARELHDDLGQQLTALKLDLSWLYNRIKENRPADPARLDEMRSLLDQAIGSVRRISMELRPLILDDLGFGEAVAWLARQIQDRAHLRIYLNLAAVDRIRDKEFSIALFRIVQESLNNVVRHAEARSVAVTLAEREGTLQLTVADDGKGFPEAIRPGAFGLVSMRERANAFGGEFNVDSKPGEGSVVTVKFSLELPVFSEAVT